MALIINNILKMIGVASACFLLFALIPFWLRGFKLTGENVADRLISSALYAHVIIMLCAFSLSLAGIYYRFTVITLLLLVAAGYLFAFRRAETREGLRRLVQGAHNLAEGYYRPRLLMRNALRKPGNFIRTICSGIEHPAALIITLAIFAYAAYTRCYHSAVNLFYGSPDIYLHAEWTKYFMHNTPFLAGVYPFGFHACVAALSSVFGINPITVLQMFGPIIGMLTIYSLYYLLRRTVRSPFAVNAALFLYAVSDILPYFAMERQFLALPQEYGGLIIYFAALFLYKYIKERHTGDLLSFCAAVSLTVSIHFYAAFFTLLICGAVFLCCLVYMKWREFKRLFIGVVCAILIAAAPLGVGLLKGIEMNGSIGWGLSFIAGENVQEEAAPEIGKPASLSDYPMFIYKTLLESGYFDSTHELRLIDPEWSSLLDADWFVPYLACAALCLLAPLIKTKKRERSWIFPAFAGYSLLMCALYILAQLDLFALMEYSRLYAYFIYSVPLVFAAPLGLLDELVRAARTGVRVVYMFAITAASVVGLLYIFWFDRFMPLGRVWYSQYNGAVAAYYKVSDNFPKGRWTMISSLSEYTQCLFDGYHYEMTEFIMNLHDYDESTTLTLPAENLFFYVVKRPNMYDYTHIVKLGLFEDSELPPFDERDVYVNLETEYGARKGAAMTRIYHDYDANRVLQAKADAWAREYIKYFPDEMTVFYDDDEITVYRIKQDPNAPLNLAIPYEGNRPGAGGSLMP